MIFDKADLDQMVYLVRNPLAALMRARMFATNDETAAPVARVKNQGNTMLVSLYVDLATAQQDQDNGNEDQALEQLVVSADGSVA